ncbi:MAG TPA: hypothetical protein P5234_00215 [Thermoanaerobaculaceae bacterium]|mgnify:CR=1 FL=1|nr:hypothetical protein [Thermoanaerobaculaceae bacterium]HRS14653.1 hypothetical protein [Thermoanaerobaculaceae bacterium]
MSREVVLKVNGELIRMNAFVQAALAGVLTGFLSALDEVPEPVREIEVSISER